VGVDFRILVAQNLNGVRCPWHSVTILTHPSFPIIFPMNRIYTLPNLISLLRIVAAPLLVVGAVLETPSVFLGVFAFSLMSDFCDGFLARRMHQESQIGSQLDTVGDVLTGVCVIGGGLLLWPERMLQEAYPFLVLVLMLTCSGIVTLVKYRHLPAYHTWSAKLSTGLTGVGAWLLFADVTPWVFRAGVGVLTLSAIEEIVITLILPKWRPNVPTFLHAVRIAGKEKEERD
jgi:CDP-diacylglycerol--glycerol-3-phosphate 3-phosphatidyltransferase